MGNYGFPTGNYGFPTGFLRVAEKPGFSKLWVFCGKIMGFYGFFMGFLWEDYGLCAKTFFFWFKTCYIL